MYSYHNIHCTKILGSTKHEHSNFEPCFEKLTLDSIYELMSLPYLINQFSSSTVTEVKFENKNPAIDLLKQCLRFKFLSVVYIALASKNNYFCIQTL